MARLPRIVLPGLPHHVTQRGNRRERTFFHDDDYALYRDLLAEAADKARVEVWAYCLMPNHVHVIVVPSDPDGIRRAFADVHRRYTGFINTRMRTTGHLWQGRFGSVAMDEAHLRNCVRYVTLNPVRAKLVERAEAWPWSSARAHLACRDDALVRVAPVLERTGPFGAFLSDPFEEDAAYLALRRAETIGRPVGEAGWIAAIEQQLGRSLAPGKRGRKPRNSVISKLSPK